MMLEMLLQLSTISLFLSALILFLVNIREFLKFLILLHDLLNIGTINDDDLYSIIEDATLITKRLFKMVLRRKYPELYKSLYK